MPERMPGRMSEYTCDCMPHRLSEQVSNRMPHRMVFSTERHKKKSNSMHPRCHIKKVSGRIAGSKYVR